MVCIFLLDRGISDVQTSYFVSMEQKKQNCLQKLPGALVSKTGKVIFSSNKQLCKLVNVYNMLFIEKKQEKETEKKQGKKIMYHSYHYLLGYHLKQRSVLPVSAIISRPDFLCLCWHTPHTQIVLHGYSIALAKTIGPTIKATGIEILLQLVLCKVRSRCISQQNWVGHEQILYQAGQKSWTK